MDCLLVSNLVMYYRNYGEKSLVFFWHLIVYEYYENDKNLTLANKFAQANNILFSEDFKLTKKNYDSPALKEKWTQTIQWKKFIKQTDNEGRTQRDSRIILSCLWKNHSIKLLMHN